MIEVHPAYDPETRTWFVSDNEFEAPSLTALAALLGPQVVIRDYYPLSRPIAAAFLERALPPTLRPMDVLRQVKVGRGGEPRQCSLGNGARRADGKPKIRIDRDALKRLWNEGTSKAEIAARLGTTEMSVTAVVGVMRRRGLWLKRRKSNFKPRGDHHVE